MSPKNQEALTVLALDLGSVHTRALLFEVVEESYRFIAAGVTPSTNDMPINDIMIGALEAVKQLQEITGRIFLNPQNALITPSQAGGEGVDRLYVAYSIGRKVRVATFGLMTDVSMQSINKLAAYLPTELVESISLNDPRTLQQKMDDVLHAQPDLLLFAGGTDRGASRSVNKMADLIEAILQLIPQSSRPQVIYSGNQILAKSMRDNISAFTKFTSTANIRPTMDEEDLDHAAEDLAHIVTEIHGREKEGLSRLGAMSSDQPCPTSLAIGRITRFLSKVGDPEKGVLTIDLGASATIAASAYRGELSLNVLPYGSGQGFADFLNHTLFSEISQWFPGGTDANSAIDTLWQKTVFPASVPMTREALDVEQSATRVLLQMLMKDLEKRGAVLPQGYETILLSGSALTQAASPAQLLLILLDGLQPKGISTLILDSHSILSTLGAIARTLPVLPVQVLESAAFTNLATVISTESNARVGVPVLRAQITYKDGKTRAVTVKQGSLVVLPLRTGESARLELEVNRLTQIGSSELLETDFKVNGGLCGIVIDARNRPLKLPNNPAIRSELFSRWNTMIGAKKVVR
jgi:hypothetical protein